MAARLTVIVSQAASRDSVVADLEETLVGELLMSDGIDANLVGPLEHMLPESTDCLCISGYRGSVAVLSWLETQQLAAAWERLGLGGQVRKFGSAPTQSGVRSVVHFQMVSGVTVDQLTSQLRKLQSDLSVKTVGIAGISVAAAPAETVKQAAPAKASEAGPSRAKSAVVSSDSSGGASGAVLPGAASRAVDARQADDDNDDFPDLEQLVDDFDALDI